jgi:hypothetical protein
MTNPTILASAKIGGHSITVQLTELDGHAEVTITWPDRATTTSDRRFPELAATLTRLFSNASIELARMKIEDRQWE